jgi:GTP-binding protein HflX
MEHILDAQNIRRAILVGVTQQGKSTLMRGLSGENVLVQNQLFAALTHTTRSVDVESHRPILLTDTVGFINRLPHHLFACFRATLQEAVQADLLLRIVDASHANFESQMATVKDTLYPLEINIRVIAMESRRGAKRLLCANILFNTP